MCPSGVTSWCTVEFRCSKEQESLQMDVVWVDRQDKQTQDWPSCRYEKPEFSTDFFTLLTLLLTKYPNQVFFLSTIVIVQTLHVVDFVSPTGCAMEPCIYKTHTKHPNLKQRATDQAEWEHVGCINKRCACMLILIHTAEKHSEQMCKSFSCYFDILFFFWGGYTTYP